MSEDEPTTTCSATLEATVGDDQAEPALARSIVIVEAPERELRDRRVPITSHLCVGRRSGALVNLVIGDPRMSGAHAVIRKGGPTGYEVHDLGSRNGTWVNGRRVSTQPLSDGDIVRVGSTFLEFSELTRADTSDEKLVGQSSVFLKVVDQIRRAAPSMLSVLLLGETGTGKEVAARRIHELSGRRGPFVAVNCSAIPAELVESHLFGHTRGAFTSATSDARGLFQEAAGGTLFLDEIGELPRPQQPKLLRVLDNGEFSPVGSTRLVKTDVRVVSATNADLPSLAMADEFRRDLFARLAGVVIELPPLRQRRSDIVRLARHFLSQLTPDRSLTWQTRALERLVVHDWPLNVRGLRSFIERIAVLAVEVTKLTEGHLESLLGPYSARAADRAGRAPAAPPASKSTRRRPPKQALVALLSRWNGEVARLAEHYGKSPRQIYRWLKAYDLRPSDYWPE